MKKNKFGFQEKKNLWAESWGKRKHYKQSGRIIYKERIRNKQTNKQGKKRGNLHE